MVLELKEATPDQLESLWTENFAEWGAPLTLEAYIECGRLELQTPLFLDGGITFWTLVDSPSTTPLCACETINRKKGWVKVPGRPVEEVPVIGIASVFTPAQRRNKGYAAALMQLLSKKVHAMTGGRGFSVLFSDIGPCYYAVNGGWIISGEACQLIIPITKTFMDTVTPELLQLKQAEEYINKDVKTLEKEFAPDSDITTVRMIPQYSELQWALLRETQAAKHLNIQTVDVVGAKSTTSGDGWGYILWFHDFKESSLTVLITRTVIGW